jgi:hypothetical protein
VINIHLMKKFIALKQPEVSSASLQQLSFDRMRGQLNPVHMFTNCFTNNKILHLHLGLLAKIFHTRVICIATLILLDSIALIILHEGHNMGNASLSRLYLATSSNRACCSTRFKSRRSTSFPEDAVFWVIAPCRLVEVYQRLRGAFCLHHQGEAASSYKTSINFYQTTRSNNPEDSHLHTRHRENLKSHWLSCLKFFVLSLCPFRLMLR